MDMKSLGITAVIILLGIVASMYVYRTYVFQGAITTGPLGSGFTNVVP